MYKLNFVGGRKGSKPPSSMVSNEVTLINLIVSFYSRIVGVKFRKVQVVS